MQYAKFVLTPRVLRVKEAQQYVGGEANLNSLVDAGWVKPLRKHKSNTSYDRLALDLAVDRANLDGWPKLKE